MNFLKSNWIASLLALTTVISEYLHLLFVGMPFNENVDLSAPVYYLITSLGGSTLITAIFIYIQTDEYNVSSRLLLAGIIGWNLIEVYENFCYLMHVNNNVLFITGSAWGQMSFILVVIFGGLFGFLKSKS